MHINTFVYFLHNDIYYAKTRNFRRKKLKHLEEKIIFSVLYKTPLNVHFSKNNPVV